MATGNRASSTTTDPSMPSLRRASSAGITAPTLVCAGRYDGIAPVSNSEAIVAMIPDTALEVFEGGHIFMMQDPRAVPRIREFLLG